MQNAIETTALTKRFKDDDDPAVDGVDLVVPVGSVCGLVGPNGSGKTTTLRMLIGLAQPTAGRARVLGEEARHLSKATRRRIGYLSDSEFPYDDLAFSDVLRFVAGFYDAWDWEWCEHLIERLHIDKRSRLDSMSKGQRRLAELMLAIAHGPDLLVLDEPALGLDVAVRRDLLWTLLETVQQRGTTVLFSSHLLQDIERVADRVVILHRGRVVRAGALDDLKANVRRLVFPLDRAPETVEGELTREAHGTEVVVVTGAWGEAMRSTYPQLVSDAPIGFEEIYLAETAAATRVRDAVHAETRASEVC